MDWHTLGDVHYRKRVLYQKMGWNISISEHVVCGAPFGGGLALIRRCGSKDILAGGVQIYNTAGMII
jgi:hypothetical protein